MLKLSEVIEGLKAGRSYKRTLECEDGEERLSPTGEEDEFRHDVAGEDHGGCSTIFLSTLNNGTWEQDGWKLLS